MSGVHVHDFPMMPVGIEEATHLHESIVLRGLGYPLYLLPFIGVAKLFGVAAILLRVPWRIKEWAYAGFAFDSLGAVYSHISVGDALSQWWGALLGVVLVGGAYALYCTRSQPSMVAAPA